MLSWFRRLLFGRDCRYDGHVWASRWQGFEVINGVKRITVGRTCQYCLTHVSEEA